MELRVVATDHKVTVFGDGGLVPLAEVPEALGAVSGSEELLMPEAVDRLVVGQAADDASRMLASGVYAAREWRFGMPAVAFDRASVPAMQRVLGTVGTIAETKSALTQAQTGGLKSRAAEMLAGVCLTMGFEIGSLYARRQAELTQAAVAVCRLLDEHRPEA